MNNITVNDKGALSLTHLVDDCKKYGNQKQQCIKTYDACEYHPVVVYKFLFHKKEHLTV